MSRDEPRSYVTPHPRVGFFGGTFDPPHEGHLALARLAREKLHLDKVLIAPVGAQPLKRDRPAAPFADRIAMTRMAIGGDVRLQLTEIDAPRLDGSPNYMIDTLRALQADLPSAVELYAIVGADAFLTIGQWRHAADLLMECPFIVGARPGFDLGRIAQALPDSISVASEDDAEPDRLTLGLRDARHGRSRLYLLPELNENVSATDIREELRSRTPTRQALAPEVLRYIRERGLYRGDEI